MSDAGTLVYSYRQWRDISEAVGDAMQYAHDRAIEHPDRADPLWNMDEYVDRVLEAAFLRGQATVESSRFDDLTGRYVFELSCGHTAYNDDSEPPSYCMDCGSTIGRQ